MTESMFITVAAFILAFSFAAIVLPFFNELTGKNFGVDVLFSGPFLAWSFVAVIVLSLVAGAYPAIALSGFKPALILKGKFANSSQGAWLRRSLVVLQFSVSAMLIVGTMVIMNQLQYLQDKKLGYNKENVIILPLDSPTAEKYESLKTELLRSGAAKYVSRGSSAPSHVKAGYSIALAESANVGIVITGLIVDEDYIPAMGIELLHGANFTEEDVKRITEGVSDGFILNETAVRELGLDVPNAIGRNVIMNGRKGEIKAVAKDFHFSSLHQVIKPLAIFVEPGNMDKVLVRLAAGNVQERLETVSRIAATLLPHRPFEYSFLDQEYARMYDAEQRMGTVFVVFAIIAIIIACLGLLGLVAYAAIQKTKEIGIRKVLGASASSVVVLITSDFLKLVIAGIVIGIPAAAYLMNMWLGNFAYRTDIGFMPVFVAAFVCILIAFATSAYHAFRAAMINPSDTLRTE